MRMLGTARDSMNERVRRPRGGADIVATYHGRASVKHGERSRAGSTFVLRGRDGTPPLMGWLGTLTSLTRSRYIPLGWSARSWQKLASC